MILPFNFRTLGALDIIAVPDKKVQKRKHRKKRINKKWAKRYGYYINSYELPDDMIYLMDRKLIMNYKTYIKIKNNIEIQEKLKDKYGL